MQGKREAGRVYPPHACVLRLYCSCELLLRSRCYVRVIRLLGSTARPTRRFRRGEARLAPTTSVYGMFEQLVGCA
jgi:hypothetical protein